MKPLFQLSTRRYDDELTLVKKAMEELENCDNRNIMVVREKVQLAKWMCSKLLPAYSDKQDIKTDTRIEIQWNVPDNKVVDVTPSITELNGGEEIGNLEGKQT